MTAELHLSDVPAIVLSVDNDLHNPYTSILPELGEDTVTDQEDIRLNLAVPQRFNPTRQNRTAVRRNARIGALRAETAPILKRLGMC